MIKSSKSLIQKTNKYIKILLQETSKQNQNDHMNNRIQKKAANHTKINQSQNQEVHQTQMLILEEATLTTLLLKRMISETSTKLTILEVNQLFNLNLKHAQISKITLSLNQVLFHKIVEP